MADATDRRRVRACAVVLARSEAQLNLPLAPAVGLAERCGRILAAAPHGGLDARSYRLAWTLAHGRA
jgi:hypothetical protein